MVANKHFLDFSGWLINWKYVVKVSLSLSLSHSLTYTEAYVIAQCVMLRFQKYILRACGGEKKSAP